MANRIQLHTERLLLRHWTDADLAPFAALNADPAVMEFFPEALDRTQSDALAAEIRRRMDASGWGMWAVEVKASQNFVGFVGLNTNEVTPRGENVEIGWRLSRDSWGKGYATEAALAALHYAFAELHLDSVVAFTTVNNLRSRAVMERLGMHNTHENFNHPKVAEDSPLREHVLYEITAREFAGIDKESVGA
jgi:RimJ/RimL family protein N-acetyltransferase